MAECGADFDEGVLGEGKEEEGDLAWDCWCCACAILRTLQTLTGGGGDSFCIEVCATTMDKAAEARSLLEEGFPFTVLMTDESEAGSGPGCGTGGEGSGSTIIGAGGESDVT
jgi:hypothetical protein